MAKGNGSGNGGSIPPAPAAVTRTRRGARDLRTALALAAAALLPVAPLLAGRMPPVGADGVKYLAFHRRLAAGLREGSIPLWNPDLHFGAPFAADVRSMAFYPPAWLGGILPPERSYALLAAAAFPIAAVGAFLLLRALPVSRAAALGGAALFAYAGWCPGRLLLAHIDPLHAYAWIPWVLAAVRLLVVTGRPRYAAGAAVAALPPALIGRPEVLFLLTWISPAAAAIWSLEQRRPGAAAARSLALLAGAGALAVAFAGFHLDQVYAFLAATDRATAGLDPVLPEWNRILPRTFVQFLLPHAFGRPVTPGYWGTAPEGTTFWIGASTLLVLALGRPRGRRALARDLPWVALGAAGLVLALGPATPFFGLVRRVVPGAAYLSAPGRYVFLLHLAVVALAACSLDRVRRREVRRSAAAIAVLGAAVAAACAAAAPLSDHLPRVGHLAEWRERAGDGFLRTIAWAGCGFGATLGLAAVLVRTVPARRRAATLVALLAAETLLTAGPWLRTAAVEAYRPAALPLDLLDALPRGPNRGWVASNRIEGRIAVFAAGAASIEGFGPLVPGAVLLAARRVAADPADPAGPGLGIDYVVAETGAIAPAGWRVAASSRSGVLLERVPPAGRVRLAGEGTFDVARPAPDRIVVRLGTRGPARLMIAERLDRGWRGWVDGRPAPLDVDALGRVSLPVDGARLVVLERDRRRLLVGLAVSWTALAASVAALRRAPGREGRCAAAGGPAAPGHMKPTRSSAPRAGPR